ncbi:hypothetical protein HSB1_45680 [Halogranum salarium B-1]|uniref:Uncharacterized protein n=1 Tax=Halogranum salarium B-1 TaxID=1210908 RepID=J3ET31_9EURY|nr:hypothetical protein HSB1_45680 [Halogranum salarium B-1]
MRSLVFRGPLGGTFSTLDSFHDDADNVPFSLSLVSTRLPIDTADSLHDEHDAVKGTGRRQLSVANFRARTAVTNRTTRTRL